MTVVGGRIFRGIPVSDGVAAGVARILGRPADPGAVPSMDVDQALDAVARELEATAERLRSAGHADEAEIVAVGALIAEDPVLREEAHAEVVAGRTVEEAIL